MRHKVAQPDIYAIGGAQTSERRKPTAGEKNCCSQLAVCELKRMSTDSINKLSDLITMFL